MKRRSSSTVDSSAAGPEYARRKNGADLEDFDRNLTAMRRPPCSHLHFGRSEEGHHESGVVRNCLSSLVGREGGTGSMRGVIVWAGRASGAADHHRCLMNGRITILRQPL